MCDKVGQVARHTALVVVAKEPVPGQSKTRLSPPFSLESAAEFYGCLLLDTLALMAQLEDVDRTVAFAPAGARDYFARIVPSGFRLIPQHGRDLGQRLAHALGEHFALGYRRVVIMNSDGPTLPLACLKEAFTALERVDVTLGPGHDGGYYLIGMKQLHPKLFQGIAWSTEQVIPQTLDICQRLGLSVHCLPKWYDVDVAGDLARLHRDLQRDPALAPHTRAFLERQPHP